MTIADGFDNEHTDMLEFDRQVPGRFNATGFTPRNPIEFTGEPGKELYD